MVGGSGEISPLPPTIFVMITNQKWQLYPKMGYNCQKGYNGLNGKSRLICNFLQVFEAQSKRSSPWAELRSLL